MNEVWLKTRFNDIDAKSIQKQADIYYKTCMRLEKNMPPNMIQVQLKEQVEQFKDAMPIVTALRNDKLEEIHWQYGWDSRRLLWYLYLLKKINFTILYNVRQIGNRDERSFLQWDSIWLDDFLKGVSWSFSRGGGGGEDTLSAPYSYFKSLEIVLNEI